MNIGIIGGGVGGLISALLLERQGFSITLFEKEERLGGRLTYVEKNGFKIDQGPTIVLLPQMLEEILTEAGISRNTYELIQCDPLYSIHFADGTRYTKYPDLDRQLEEIRSIFPGEEKGFQRFLQEGKTRFALGKKAFLDHAFVPRKTFWTYENMKTLLKLKPYQSVKKLMDGYFQDERLQIAYSLQTLYIGGNPFHAPALYSLVPFSEHEHGVYYLKGGYAGLVSLLEQELKRRAISVYKNTRVTRIIREGTRVTGLVVDGDFVPFDGIVFNGDYPLLSDLINMPKKRIYTPSSSCVLIYFGLNRVYREADVHQFFISRDFKKHMKEVFREKSVPEEPSFYTFHPSKIDISLAPPGKGVLYTLVPVPSGQHINWNDQKYWIEKIIRRMEEAVFPGLTDSMEWMEIRTPQDAYHFGLYQGGMFGIEPSLFQSGVFRPQAKPLPIDNLYAAGASIHPGGGIPIVMQGARLMVRQLVQDFLATSPSATAFSK